MPKEPVVESRANFNPLTSIWIVPFVALMISLWLVYQHYSRLGPVIQIFFKSSDGLNAGQSEVKFRNVPVGKVTKIALSNSMGGVIVTVQMDKNSDTYLNESTKFWVVKPRVDYSGVSGLETLISGSYIAMYAKNGENTAYNFSGLDIPYRDVNSGSYFLMHATVSRGIRVGTPINYRNIQIGVVEHINLASDGKSIDVVSFVNKQYVHLINKTTKFWLQSLINIGIHGNRLDLDIAPVVSHLFFGGITFETKTDKDYPQAEPSYFYHLYDNRYEAEGQKLGMGGKYKENFIFEFDGDVSGLKKGSSIKFDGFDIGEIVANDIEYSHTRHTMHSIAIGEIDTSIFQEDNRTGIENLISAVKSGMRAKLTSVNPLIGDLYIDMVFDKNSTDEIELKFEDGKYTYFPVLDRRKDNLLSEINLFVAKLNSLKLNRLVDSTVDIIDSNNKPLREMIDTMTKTSLNLDDTLRKVDNITDDESMKKMPKKINIAIEELSRTLDSTKKLLKGYRSNSLFGDKVSQMLKEINRSSQETKRLLKKLNKKPNSLIFGD